MYRIGLFLFAISLCFPFVEASHAQHFASGIKIGEVDQNSAIVWARLTKEEVANFDLVKSLPKKFPMPVDVAPGEAGEIELTLTSSLDDGSYQVRILDWVSVEAGTDFTHQFLLSELEPDTSYEFSIKSRMAGAESIQAELLDRLRRLLLRMKVRQFASS